MYFYSSVILAFGPYINVSNWTFIIIAILITPIAFYVDHHFYNRDANTRIKDLLSVFPRRILLKVSLLFSTKH